MKEKLPAYWCCQIGGWSAYVLLTTFYYLFLPGFSIWNTLFPMLLAGTMGIFITHLMRLFVMKSGLLEQSILKQIIYLLLTTAFFSFIYAAITIWLFGTLHWGQQILNLFTHEYKMSGLSTLMSSDIFFLGIWNLIYFSYHYVEKSRRQQMEAIRMESELKIQELEKDKAQIEYQRNLGLYHLTALRYQMNPHFIFNCLNSINLYTTQNDSASASAYLTKFSKLIRLVMENSAKGKILLAAELNMLSLYVDMEAMRFKEKLQYTIHLEKDVEPDYIELPPLLLQPYVENAIWHGLMPKEEGGKIHIEVAINNFKSLLQITIEDNGIGRARSADFESKKTTVYESYGMKVTSNRIALINQVYKSGAEVMIHDLIDEHGIPSGTKVIIQIPV